MPRISLWNPVKGDDYSWTDKAIGENMRIAGDGILVHLYLGPTTDSQGNTNTDLTTIQDVLFLTNINRKYDPNVFELRGNYQPVDVGYDLSQFGIFLSSDTIRIFFHYKDMQDSLGRRLVAGDVLEFPNMRDTPVFEGATGINRFYVVQDSLWAANGYGPKWFPHIWLVKAKMITASPEYQTIIDQAATGQTAGGVGESIGIMPPGWTDMINADGNPGPGTVPAIRNSLDLLCRYLAITDAVVKEAEDNVFFDPVFFQSANLYIYVDDKGYPMLGVNYMSGSYIPPNGAKLVGIGIQFPTTMKDGEYYLRTDYYPDRLFQKQGNCFKYIEENLIKCWTAYNKVLDTFIDNNRDTILPNGDVIPEKQAVSKVVPLKVDLYAEAKKGAKKDRAAHDRIANKRATCPGPVTPEGQQPVPPSGVICPPDNGSIPITPILCGGNDDTGVKSTYGESL